jgi:hypothetical protein
MLSRWVPVTDPAGATLTPQQLGFESFMSEVEESNQDFKQSQKVRRASGGGPRGLDVRPDGDPLAQPAL